MRTLYGSFLNLLANIYFAYYVTHAHQMISQSWNLVLQPVTTNIATGQCAIALNESPNPLGGYSYESMITNIATGQCAIALNESPNPLWLWINDQWSSQLNNHGQSHHTFCIISITQDDLILHSLSMLRAPAPKLTHTHTLPTHHSQEIEFFPIMDRSYSFQLSWKIKLRNRWSAQKMEA